MKYLLLLTVLVLSGCSQPDRVHELPTAIGRFTDGNVTCYTFYEHSISCIRDASPGGR